MAPVLSKSRKAEDEDALILALLLDLDKSRYRNRGHGYTRKDILPHQIFFELHCVEVGWQLTLAKTQVYFRHCRAAKKVVCKLDSLGLEICKINCMEQ